MKSLKSLLIFLFLFSTLSYAQTVQLAKAGSTYGKTITKEGAFPVSLLPQKMGSSKSLATKVSGKVVEVCTKKGCWMKLENTNGESTRITFKDYGFFMPENIVGKNVILEGVSNLKTISVAELKHYAEDAGKPQEEIAKINMPRKEITFEAAGVLVL